MLTAAHCVDGAIAADTFFIVAAESVDDSGPTYSVASIAMTPGYIDFDVNAPDLAVLRLEGAVPGISPLSLSASSLTEGTTLLGVGFGQDETNGATGVKRSGVMEFFAKDVGAGALPSGGDYEPALLWVKPETSDQLTCPGDSGDPLLDASGVIVGVASFITLPKGTPASQSCTSAMEAANVSVPDSAALIVALGGVAPPLPAPPGATTPPPAPAVPGACRTENTAFTTTGGGCRDNRSGLVYSRRLPTLRQERAQDRCKDIVTGGYDDWRLPTAKELRGMAKRGGQSHLAGGSAARLWSRTREGDDGVTVKMDTGEKNGAARNPKRPLYCVRG